MPKVLISDKMASGAAKIFRERGLDVDVITGMTPEELKEVICTYDGLAVRSATKVTREILTAAPNLKVIGRAGIGVDNVDIPAATAQGTIVMNTPFGNAITTAEHTISMMMSLVRHIPLANTSTHEGKWEKTKFMGTELFGKTLGVIGAGNIGTIVIDRAQGLKMRVIAFDPFLSAERATEMAIEKVTMDELLARADIITIHTPMTDHTKGILNKDTLAQTKQGVRIINCARGGLIVEEDLKSAIESGHVAGAAFDVFSEEPAKENALFGMPQVICTPHLGASTTEAQDNVALQVAEQIADYLLTGAVTNALNAPSVSAEEAPRLAPYIELTRQMGSFAGQITETSIKSVIFELQGHAADLNNTLPLKSALAEGLLKPMVSNVNMVNAPKIAKDRGMEYNEVKTDRTGDYQTLLTLTVNTERQSRTIRGTLTHGTKPRLVDIHGVNMEAELGPFMLYVTNHDQPGFIGALGTALGDAKINVATFYLGRRVLGKDALSLIQVDKAADDETLSKIRALEHVKEVKQLSF